MAGVTKGMMEPARMASAESNNGSLAQRLAGGLKPAALFLGAYFVLSIVARLMLPNGLTLDEAEQSLFSQHWLLGYGPQPPFYNWVQTAVVSLMGISLLSLALPKFVMLFLCYFFYGLAAREISARPALVSLAMLSLLALPQVSYMPQQDLTHTVAVLMATALFLYGLCRTLSRPDWQGYAILGIAIGIGTISKYNFVLLPAATLLAVLCDRTWRVRLWDLRVLLTAVLSLAIVLPHALWLGGHMDLATGGTISKMVEANAPHGFVRVLKAVGSLAVACLAFGALAAVVLGLSMRHTLPQALRASDPWTRLLGRIMLFSLAGVVLVILVAGTTKITERWLDPYLLALPLYLLLKFERAGADMGRLLPRLLPFFLVVMGVALLPGPAKTLGAAVTGSYGRMNMPFDRAGEQLRAQKQPAVIIAKGMHLAGNMRLQFLGIPVIDADDPADAAARTQDMGPVLLVWIPPAPGARQQGLDPSAVAQQMQLSVSATGMLELPYHYSRGGGDLWKLGYAWLQ
jgi:4-amino-4-deoxy-L-arabinose transferase-like glycosyltransferase